LDKKADTITKLPLPPTDPTRNQSLSYKEWLKHKDAERRLKRKLIT